MRSGLPALVLFVLLGTAAAPAAVAEDAPADLVAALPATVLGAHRAAALEGPEGTVAGIEAALSAGSHVVDLDARVLADGEVVVSHDGTTTRLTTSQRSVASLTSSDWSALTLDVRAWFGDVAGAAALTLRQVLQQYAGRVVLLIELKSAAALPGTVARVQEAAAEGSVILQSNDPSVVRQVRDAGLHANLWRTPAQLAVDDPASWTASGAEQLVVRSTTGPEQLARALASGLPVWACGANDPTSVAALLGSGVRGILSDAPAFSFGRTTARRTLPVAHFAGSLRLRRGTTGYVEGRVVLPALGSRVPGAQVAVTVGGVSVRATSDGLGRFRVPVRAPSVPGTYAIRISTSNLTVAWPGSEVTGWPLRGTSRVDGVRPLLRVVR